MASKEKWIRENPGKRARGQFRAHLKRIYKLDPLVFDEMVIAQSGLCEICQEELVDVVVDHDHQTGEVRGLLCRSCNFLLEHAKDSLERLRSAAEYLVRA